MILSLIPAMLFLLLLYLLDSFKLVHLKCLLIAFTGGVISAVVAFIINTYLFSAISNDINSYTKYASPIIEETLKAIVIIALIKRRKIGFLIDAGIYGFAAGTGFSIIENAYYLLHIESTEIVTLLIRGFGTSVMHGGCTALLAIVIMGSINADNKKTATSVVALVLATGIHSIYNQFYINPIIQTIAIVTILPLALTLIFKYNETHLRKWLEIELFSEIELLGMIRKGKLKDSKSGEYINTLKQHFSKEMIVDFYCYLSLFLDLSVIFKRNMILIENEMPPIKDKNLGAKLKEIKQLRRNIGKTGEMAIAPLIQLNYRDLWKLSQLNAM